MTTYLGKSCSFCAFRKLSSIYVFSYFPFGFEGRIWNLIVSVPDHCLSFYFSSFTALLKAMHYGDLIHCKRHSPALNDSKFQWGCLRNITSLTLTYVCINDTVIRTQPVETKKSSLTEAASCGYR